MLPRSIPRLYDNISTPPPQSYGMYYAQTLSYVTQNSSSSILQQCAAFKWSSPYAPFTQFSIPKWKPRVLGIDGLSVFKTPDEMYDVKSTGTQGVVIALGTNVPSWNKSTIYGNYYKATMIEMGPQTQYQSTGSSVGSASIVVGIDRSKYIMVPYIKAMNASGSTWEGSYQAYKNQITAYPYIYEMYANFYYKSNLGGSSTGSQISIGFMCNGMNNLKVPYGAPSDMYCNNYQYTIICNTYFSMGGSSLSFFRSPPIFGCMYHNSQFPTAVWPSFNANGAATYQGNLGTHSHKILKFINRTPPDDLGANWDNFHSMWYADFDIATKIINSMGLVWAESQAEIANYRGSATASTNVHVPIITEDGTTSGDDWSGADIYNNWDNNPDNSDYFNTYGDIMTGNIDLTAPVDMTAETDTKDLDENTDELLPTTPLLNGLGVFASYYALTIGNVQGLSDFLWNADETVIDDVINSLKLFGQNPINAIMSLRLYPFNIYDLLPTHEPTRIILGRVDTEVYALKIPSNASTVLDLGTLYVKPRYNDFRDYAPYTSYNVYIPFIGTVNINPNDFLAKVLSIKMVVDITTGKATAILYAAGIPMQYLDGMIGVDIPITSENMGQTASAVISAVGSVAGAALTGNAVSLAASMASGAADVLFNDVSINKQGNVSPAASLSMPINAYMIVSRPNCVIPENYGHSRGYACDLAATVSNLKGFTVCQNVDTSGIPATEKERNEIKTLMEGGIYL